MDAFLLLQIREVDLQVAAELPQDLPARAAGRRRRLGVGDDRNPREDAVAFGERLEHRDAFGADGEAVRRVLDVAPGDDGAVARLQRGADLEVREGGLRVLAGAARGADEVEVFGSLAQPPGA